MTSMVQVAVIARPRPGAQYSSEGRGQPRGPGVLDRPVSQAKTVVFAGKCFVMTVDGPVPGIMPIAIAKILTFAIPRHSPRPLSPGEPVSGNLLPVATAIPRIHDSPAPPSLRPSAGCCWHPTAAIRAANWPASCNRWATSTPSRRQIFPTRRGQFAGIVVDINLRSPESVQLVRNKLRAEPYRAMPRLFVLADALHHGSMQAWALGATDTIARPFDAPASCSASARRFRTAMATTRPTAARP